MKNLIALLLVLLVGCGGGGPDAAEAPIVVRMHGDSTQAGAGADGVSGPAVAQAILADAGRGHITVINEGVGGTTSRLRLLGGLTKVGTPMAAWRDVITTRPAAFVSFKYGLNDARYYSEEVFRGYLTRLIDLSEDAGISVILETPSPTDAAADHPKLQENIERNVEVIRAIAAQRPSVTLCDHWEYGLRVGFENRDGFHPTARAYQEWIGPEAARCILRAVKKRGAQGRRRPRSARPRSCSGAGSCRRTARAA